MKRISAVALGFAIGAFSLPASAQLVVENEPGLSSIQREVLPLLEPILRAVLQEDRAALIDMFQSSDTLLTIPQRRGIATFQERINDPSDIYSCVIFDTACARSYFAKLGDSFEQDDPRKGNSALLVGRVFVSIKEFLEKHKGEMQVTFQRQPEGQVQAELHVPRRPDGDQVPPPLGLYESLTIGFVKTSAGWKINQLFPEIFLILTQFF